MADDNITVLGAANQQEAQLKARNRRGSSIGPARYTVEVTGDSIVVNTDPKSLGRPVAEAIAEHLKERIRGITAAAAPATIKAREAAAKALAQGKAWAVKRYSGGRIGSRTPGQHKTLFRDSGRLEESIAVGATNDGYVVNVAANRFSPDTFDGGEGALQQMFAKLKQYIPELADPSKWFDATRVQKAVAESIGDALQKAGERQVDLIRQKASARIQAARALIGLVMG